MVKHFPETLLIISLILVGTFAYRAAHRTYPFATVEVAPSKDVVGTCRYQGRYWLAQRDPGGAFHCFLKDAP